MFPAAPSCLRLLISLLYLVFPLTFIRNRVRDVSHGDDSSDRCVLDKQIMCQGTFPNAYFPGKLQADRVWEGRRRKTSP